MYLRGSKGDAHMYGHRHIIQGLWNLLRRVELILRVVGDIKY